LFGVKARAVTFWMMIDSPKKSSSELPSILPTLAGVAPASSRRNTPW
jgi:hypothetical protein